MPSFAAALVAIVLAMTSIQLGASIAKQLFPIVGAVGATSLRISLATLMLIGFWKPWRGGPLSRKEITALTFYGFSLGGMNLLFYLALNRIPLGITVALEFTGPLAVALLSSRKAVDFLWAGLAAIGIVLITRTADNSTSGAIDPIGVLLALAAGACWAGYILFGQKAGSSVQGGRATTLGMVAATVLVFPIGMIQTGARLFDLKVLPLALGVALLSSAVPYSLEMVGLKRIPTKTFGILMSLEPALAALSGLLILHEELSLFQWIAIASVISASLGSSLTSKDRSSKAKETASFLEAT